MDDHGPYYVDQDREPSYPGEVNDFHDLNQSNSPYRKYGPNVYVPDQGRKSEDISSIAHYQTQYIDAFGNYKQQRYSASPSHEITF